MSIQKIKLKYKNLPLAISVNQENKNKNWLICLHGIQSNSELFNGLLKQDFIKDFSYLAIDLVGFGNSSKPKELSYDLEDQAEVCKLLVEKLEPESIFIIGHSLGGMIGILLLPKLGNKVKLIISLEGNLVDEDSGLSKVVASYSFEEFKDKKYKEIKSKNIERIKWLNKIPDYVFYKTAKSIVKWAKSKELLKIFLNSNTTRSFIYGDKNSVKANVLTDQIKKISIPNSGHFMIIDNPKATYEAIHACLASI